MPNKNVKEKYNNLINLTQLFLFREFSLNQWVDADSEILTYFKQQYAQKKALQPIAPQTRSPGLQELKSTLPVQPNIRARQQPQAISPPSIPAEPKKENVVASSPSTIHSPSAEPAKPETSGSPSSPVSAIPASGLDTSLKLQPLGPVLPADLSDIRNLVKQLSPSLLLIEEIPSDLLAREVSDQWKKPLESAAVLILTLNESDKQRSFLGRIAKAIQVCLATAQINSAIKIERDKEWDAILKSEKLRLVIATDSAIATLPELAKHFREDSRHAKSYLGTVPLLLLPDLSVYFKEPSLKSSLWRNICSLLGM